VINQFVPSSKAQQHMQYIVDKVRSFISGPRNHVLKVSKNNTSIRSKAYSTYSLVQICRSNRTDRKN